MKTEILTNFQICISVPLIRGSHTNGTNVEVQFLVIKDTFAKETRHFGIKMLFDKVMGKF